jgi:hypothetical protein
LVDEIAKVKAERWSRPIAPDRAYATAKDIAPKVPAVAATQRAGLWSQVMGWLGFGGAAAKGIVSFMPDANDQFSPWMSMFQGWFKWLADVPGWVPMLIVAAVALGSLEFLHSTTPQASPRPRANHRQVALLRK